MTSRSNSFSNFSESSYEYDDKDCSTVTTSDRDEPLNPGHRNNSFNGLLGFTFGSKKMRKKKPFCQEKAIVGLALLVIGFVGMNWWMLSRIQNSGRASQVEFRFLEDNSSTLSIRVCLNHSFMLILEYFRKKVQLMLKLSRKLGYGYEFC